MSLYDGLGMDSKEKGHREQKSDLTGWSSGIKLLQTQLQLKKAALTQAKQRDQSSRKGVILAPVFDLKTRKDEPEDMPPPPPIRESNKGGPVTTSGTSLLGGEWDVRLEYDPLWPNDYEKILRERKEKKERDREEDKRRDAEERDSYRNRRRDRHERNREPEMRVRNEEEELERERERPRRGPVAGAAIAPPPSLAEPERKENNPPSFSGLIPSMGGSVAARIMAKYGFKEGQGLGKQEQGMSQALQVEKTSKRGGKIIHERDLPPKADSPPPSPPDTQPTASQSPTNSNPPESITNILRNPSKVVLLRNMVGPGEVDEELEPETKEECGKYGDVSRCLIFEIPGGNIPEEDAVRIFVEFKRVESAIKAVVDLNGRYFGGRIVRAGFYDVDKFKNLELME